MLTYSINATRTSSSPLLLTFTIASFYPLCSYLLLQVEYVKQEAKVVYLLQVLQKTPPPVLVFAENKKDVDEVQEYLLLKGVAAVSIHGGKSQVHKNRRMLLQLAVAQGEQGQVELPDT